MGDAVTGGKLDGAQAFMGNKLQAEEIVTRAQKLAGIWEATSVGNNARFCTRLVAVKIVQVREDERPQGPS